MLTPTAAGELFADYFVAVQDGRFSEAVDRRNDLIAGTGVHLFWWPDAEQIREWQDRHRARRAAEESGLDIATSAREGSRSAVDSRSPGPEIARAAGGYHPSDGPHGLARLTPDQPRQHPKREGVTLDAFCG